MRTYSIWSEGFAATGERGTAMYHGSASGNNFKEACINFFKKDQYFDKNCLSYWGCALYEDESDARRSFG